MFERENPPKISKDFGSNMFPKRNRDRQSSAQTIHYACDFD